MQVVANHAGEQDDLGGQHDDEQQRQRAADDVDDLGVGLQQVAQRGQAERNACGGDGNLFDNLAHGATFLLPRIILLDARGWEGFRAMLHLKHARGGFSGCCPFWHLLMQKKTFI